MPEFLYGLDKDVDSLDCQIGRAMKTNFNIMFKRYGSALVFIAEIIRSLDVVAEGV